MEPSSRSPGNGLGYILTVGEVSFSWQLDVVDKTCKSPIPEIGQQLSCIVVAQVFGGAIYLQLTTST